MNKSIFNLLDKVSYVAVYLHFRRNDQSQPLSNACLCFGWLEKEIVVRLLQSKESRSENTFETCTGNAFQERTG